MKAETGLLDRDRGRQQGPRRAVPGAWRRYLWIGARTTVSPFSVQEIADALRGTDIPVFVKNPINAELGLWLGAIERLYAVGVRKLGAIHRGFSTYVEMQFRNDPKWQIPIEIEASAAGSALDLRSQPHLGRPPVRRAGLADGDGPRHPGPDHRVAHRPGQGPQRRQAAGHAGGFVPDAGPAAGPRRADPQPRGEATNRPAAPEISQIDTKIIQDLAERMKWVEEIGRLKQEHSIPVLQLDRWESLLGDHIARAQKAGLDPEFIKAIFELIHAQAVKRQL